MKIKEQPNIPVMDHLNTMTEVAVDMMRRAMMTFVERDGKTARSIPILDNQVTKASTKFLKGLSPIWRRILK